jgi:hypothetical protein
MKAHIFDKPALEAIRPAALRAYLIYEGWKKIEAYGEFSEVYVDPSEQKLEVIIPFTADIVDYASAVGAAIKYVSSFENRDELAVYADLTRADRDVLRVRAPEADDDGSISLDPGVEIVQHARNLLASAACAAFETRRAYHVGKIQQAEDYMHRVRMGQTEHGSFVVTLLAPMPPALTRSQQTLLWPNLEEEPYERKVTRVLAQALGSARDAIIASNRGEGMDAFTNAVARGVSANLCEAVAAIIDQANGADLSLTWAKTRPTPEARSHIVFKRSDAEVLKEASRQLRLDEPRRDEHILGYVTRLKRHEDEIDGFITIKSLIDNKVRALSAYLSPADYHLAIKAHDEKKPISIIGDIEMSGQRWRVVSPREVKVIGDTEDADSD